MKNWLKERLPLIFTAIQFQGLLAQELRCGRLSGKKNCRYLYVICRLVRGRYVGHVAL